MESQLEKIDLDYEFFDAVEGRELDPDDPELADPKWREAQGADWYAGANLGAALSHLNVYRKILNDGHQRALVLEDDAALPPDISSLADDVAACMTAAEVVLLCFFSPRSAARGEPLRLSRHGSVELPSSRLLAVPVNVVDVANSAAYVITREACEGMARTVLPVRADADRWAFFCEQGALSSVRCIVPMPVTQGNFRSTIASPPRGLKSKVVAAASKVPVMHSALIRKRERQFASWYRAELVDDPPQESV